MIALKSNAFCASVSQYTIVECDNALIPIILARKYNPLRLSSCSFNISFFQDPFDLVNGGS